MNIYFLTGWLLSVGGERLSALPEIYETEAACQKRIEWITNNKRYVAETHLACEAHQVKIPIS